MSESKEHVIQTVRDALNEHKPDRIDVSLREEDVHEEYGVWQVPLVIGTRPKRLYDLYDQLADVEIELQDELGLKVLLLPAYR